MADFKATVEGDTLPKRAGRNATPIPAGIVEAVKESIKDGKVRSFTVPNAQVSQLRRFLSRCEEDLKVKIAKSWEKTETHTKVSFQHKK